MKIQEQIKQGEIFIYPTDTLYGLGCDATNIEAVNKIKEIKSRDKDKPMSIIAPNKEWIQEHCIVDVDLDKYLPGPYTLLLKKKDPSFLSHVSDNDSLGIRIPAHNLTKQIQESGIPFITTSVNLSGEPFALDLNDISEDIKKQVDEIIESKEKLSGIPSTLIINGKEVRR